MSIKIFSINLSESKEVAKFLLILFLILISLEIFIRKIFVTELLLVKVNFSHDFDINHIQGQKN